MRQAAISENKIGAVLIAGGGIGGIQASLDLADSGFKVYLVEKNPSIGGVMAQLDKTFPTNDCSMCILAPKLVAVSRHPNIELITNAEVEDLSGEAGNFVAIVKKKPRYVDENKCTGCGVCSENCPIRKAVYPVQEASSPPLSEEDLNKMQAIIKEHRDKTGKLMPVLQKMNREYNYLPPDMIRHVAKEFHIPLTSVFNIATFYNSFSLTPRGRHIVNICLGTSCYVRGGARILKTVAGELGIAAGETTGDLNFSIETVRCLGCCSISPVIMVDDKVYGKVESSQVKNILGMYK